MRKRYGLDPNHTQIIFPYPNFPHLFSFILMCPILCLLLQKVLMMVGIRPVPDALGRVNKLEVIPLEELGRPRVDVVVNCSGMGREGVWRKGGRAAD